MYVARITRREGKAELLTLADYRALRWEEYTWALDGFSEPPVCHRGEGRIGLTPDEFRALAKLVRRLGASMAPRAELFEGEPSSKEAAIRRFEKARKKVEPVRRRGAGAFRTVGGGADRRFRFEPSPELKYCLIERLDPPVQFHSQEGIARVSPVQWSLPDLSSILQSTWPVPTSPKPLKPSGPVGKLIPKSAPPVEGITLVVHRLTLVRRHVRARVTVSNTTAETKFVAYFSLHVGARSWKAVHYLPGNRRRVSSKAKSYLKPEMLLVRARKAIVGFLFFFGGALRLIHFWRRPGSTAVVAERGQRNAATAG